LDNFINSLVKKSNNKDSKNVMDEGKAGNYSDESNNSDDIDNNDFGDSDSSNNNKGNKACRCAGRQELLTFIIS